MLVVEDDLVIASGLRMLLGNRGLHPQVVGTVAQGLEALEQEPAPAVVIADLMLPDGSGEQILRRVRERHLPTRVIVTTGVSDPERLRQLDALQPTAVLRKPFEFSHLLELIRG